MGSADECAHPERVASLEGMARPIAWDVITSGAIAGSTTIACDTNSLCRLGGEHDRNGHGKSCSDDRMHCKLPCWNDSLK